jgi:hypothetical protein
MTIMSKDNLPAARLPGRVIYKAVGKDGESKSTNMSVGFGHYSAESGMMEPHRHAEESVFIIASQKGIVRYGGDKDSLLHSLLLAPGMLLHIPEMEWHVFEYEEGGFVDILFIYGQVTDIRPEGWSS